MDSCCLQYGWTFRLNGISQKEKKTVYDLTGEWDTNRNKCLDSHNRCWLLEGKGTGRRAKWLVASTVKKYKWEPMCGIKIQCYLETLKKKKKKLAKQIQNETPERDILAYIGCVRFERLSSFGCLEMVSP